MIKKIATLLILAAITCNAMSAATVTESQARAIAGRFFNVTMPQQPATMKGHGAKAAYYVFNNPEQPGWVIVAGDDRARTILAYSDENYFDASEVPECVQDWLNDYAQQLSRLDMSSPAQPNAAPTQAIAAGNKVRIAPLLRCNWAQGLPFNQQCDGYTDGLYHINWGWRGHQNGYFALNALNDDNAGGTGAAVGDEGYTINVQIMTGLQPDLGTGTSTNGNIVGLYRTCEASPTSYTRSNSEVAFTDVSLTAYYWNFSSQTYTYDLGWGLYDSDGNLISTHTAVSGKSLSASYYTTVTKSITMGKGLTGTYYLKPMCRLSGSSTYLPCRGSGINFIKATITATRLTLKVCDELEVMNLKVNSVTTSPIKKVGSPLQLTLNVTNQGLTDYNSIYMWVGGNKISGTYTDIAIGQTGNVVMNYTPSATGSITFEFTADADGTKVLKTATVVIGSATAASISGSTLSSVVGTTFNASINAKNNNTSAYNDYIVAKLYKKENNTSSSGYYCSAQSQLVNLAAGSSQNVEFAFTNLDYNETYFVNFYYYNNGEQVRINGTATRKVESPYLVTSITLDEQEMTLNVGEERTLAATVLPDDADYKTVLWTSSNPEVASVDASGLVTALSHGTTTITATTTDGSNLSATCLVTVVEEPVFTAGDVNDDGDINIGDYASVASYILEQDPQPFNFAAADLDGNNEINVGDLAGVAHLALHYECGAPQGAPAVNAAKPRIAIDASTSGNTVTINLSNNVGITALQMDLGLPQGTALVDATLTDRASASHQVAFSQLANGQYRLLASSSTCKTLAGTSGAVLTLTLAGTPSGNGSLSNIVLAPLPLATATTTLTLTSAPPASAMSIPAHASTATATT